MGAASGAITIVGIGFLPMPAVTSPLEFTGLLVDYCRRHDIRFNIPDFQFISSSAIRELATYRSPAVVKYVTPCVKTGLLEATC